LAQRAAFWIMMGRTLLIRVRKLVSSGVSTGWICVFSSGQITEECLSKNDIRSRLILGGVCFSIFMGVPLIYDALFCSSSFTGLCSSCVETWLLLIIYLPLKKILWKDYFVNTS
jgi:hypothetical protein